MSSVSTLSLGEFASLTEVGRTFLHDAISPNDATRLLELRLIYNLLGSVRVTKAGRARLLLGE